MSNTGRIAVVAVIAVVAFGGAFLLAGGDDQTTTTTASDEIEEETNPCDVDDVVPVEEAGYEVTVATEPDPPVPQGTTFEVMVQRDGAPVGGATVCLRAEMSEMSHQGVSQEADEIGPGSYEMAVNFGMRGGWNGSLLVVEPGQAAGSMPVSFRVQ